MSSRRSIVAHRVGAELPPVKLSVEAFARQPNDRHPPRIGDRHERDELDDAHGQRGGCQLPRRIPRLRVEQPNCTRLRVGTSVSETDYTATAGGVRVTRVAGTPPTTHVLSSFPGYIPGEWVVETVDGTAFCQYQKGQRWITASTVTGLYFRIHVTEIPPAL